MLTIFLALAIFISSFLGILYILFKKIPDLTALPERALNKVSLKEIFSAGFEKIHIKDFPAKLSFDIFLHKILSRVRIIILRLENKINKWITTLRERTQQKNIKGDNYWQKIKRDKVKKK